MCAFSAEAQLRADADMSAGYDTHPKYIYQEMSSCWITLKMVTRQSDTTQQPVICFFQLPAKAKTNQLYLRYMTQNSKNFSHSKKYLSYIKHDQNNDRNNFLSIYETIIINHNIL